MKGLILIAVSALVIYFVWQTLSKEARSNTLRVLWFHGLRIGGILLVIGLLAWLAYLTPVIAFLF